MKIIKLVIDKTGEVSIRNHNNFMCIAPDETIKVIDKRIKKSKTRRYCHTCKYEIRGAYESPCIECMMNLQGERPKWEKRR